MDNQKVTNKIGRPKIIHTPIKYYTEEERKDAIRQSKTKYMLTKSAGKTKHLKTN